uniref:Uncharacterized protein n=1 Tax=Pipistrellus kuhlii TaxID=59472 RepID=A0A7J7YMH0_PIPKU|nr:hypothetical protein mPipKuh1_010101 [Pipistrellus kuhlii]
MRWQNNFKMGVDNIEKLLEVVPEELNSEELLELEQKHIAEDAREKETVGEEKEKLPRKCTVKRLAEPFADLNKLLKNFENITPNIKKFFLIERYVHSTLSAYKQVYNEKTKHETNQANHHRRISEKVISPQEELQASCSEGIPEEDVIISIRDDKSFLTLKTFQWDEI